MTALKDEQETGQRRPWRSVLVWVGIVGVLIVGGAAYALVRIWSPMEAHVLSYAGLDETTLYAYVEIGAGESFAAAFAEETSTTVTLHVLYRQSPGSYSGPAWMAGERITLESPLGGRTVRNAAGDRLGKQHYDPMPTVQEMTDWLAGGKEGPPPMPAKGTVEGTVLVYGGPLGEDGTSSVAGEPAAKMPVQIRDETTGQVIQDVSSRRGQFRLPLPVGEYALLCAPELPFTIEDGGTVTLTCKMPIP